MCLEFAKMKHNKNKLHTFLSNAELQEIKNTAGSHVHIVKCEHHLSLHPFHSTDINTSINELLHKEVTKYNKKLGGIVLGFQNVKVLCNKAPINFDSCFIYVDVEVEFYVFKPEVDQVLTGTVNKKSEHHVGCLVHKIFNVSLTKHDDKEWLGDKAQLGHEVQFKITFIDLDSRLPYIRGDILSVNSEDSGISTSEEAMTKNKHTKFDESNYEEELVPKKKKKSKKHKEDINVSESQKKSKKKKRKQEKHIELGEERKNKEKTIDSDATPSTKKSKKKKHKEQNDLDVSLPELNLETLFDETPHEESTIIKSAKKNKRKHSTSHDISWASKEHSLVPDSDMEEILDCFVSKKRKHATDEDGPSGVSKKGKKSKVDVV